jgi:tetratricopeptide (TPR) repeat protein
MRSLIRPISIALLLATGATAFAAGGGGMPASAPAMPAREPVSPEEQALTAYNAGVRAVERGDELAADAARQTDARKQEKAHKKAQSAYGSALKSFKRAADLNPRMHEAWNYVGYTNRKLGDYDAALGAYERALKLKPDYAEAIEYRGHAYLGLNRLSEAKEAYLALYTGNRALAAKLLTAMQEWVGAHRGSAGVDGAALDAFASWVNERSTIAAQTAGLTREGAKSSW